MDSVTAYIYLFFRIFLCVGILFFLLITLFLLFNRNNGKNVIAKFINASNGDEVDISSWEVSLGRAKTCDIILNNPTVSRFHAVIARRGKGWIIFDTNSKTGITVNGEKVDKSAFIYDGDTVTMGTSVMYFRSPLFKRPGTEDKTNTDAGLPLSRQGYAGNMHIAESYISALVNMTDNSLVLLFSDSYIIGRAPDCDIILPVMSVSKKNTRLMKYGRTWTVSDMNSSNGTYVNGTSVIGEIPLCDGDTVSCGGIHFRFCEKYMKD